MRKKKGIYIVLTRIAVAVIIILQLTKYNPPVNNQTIANMAIPENESMISEDSLMTYARFKKIADSIKSMEQWQESVNKGLHRSGVDISFIGLTAIAETKPGKLVPTVPEAEKYYLVLPGYTLRDQYNTSFYVDSNKYYIQYPTWDRINGDGSGHYETKQVPFRFSYTQEGQKGAVLIPVSRQSYRILSPFIYGFVILGAIFLFYVIYGLSVNVLMRIAGGHVFIPANISALHFLAYTLMSLPFIMILIQFILKLSFYRYTAGNVDLAWVQTLFENRSFLLAGIVTFIIAKAFKRGYTLQNEQDLTI